MYKQIWEKYLPIVRILMKKSEAGIQTLDLNKLDFDAAGISKSSFKFRIEFRNGRVSNVIHESPIAVELAHQLLDNEQTSQILNKTNIVISASPKYQLTIKPLKS
jgi:hypothetical protein